MKLLFKAFKYLFIFILIAIVGLSALYWESDIPLEKLKEKYSNADSKFIEVDGMSVHYRVEGLVNDSIPLVLLHGTGASLHTWDGWVNALKNDRN